MNDSYLSKQDYLAKIYDHMVNHNFPGQVMGDFPTVAQAIIRDYAREIICLKQFNKDSKDVAEYLCQFFRIKPDRSGNFIKEVANDYNGWKEIVKIRELYKSRGRAIRLRGRGKNRAARMAAAGLYYNHTHDLAIKVSDRIAIYER
jgi:hypothetical protein